MSWRTVIITNRCKLDYRMGYMVVRGDEIKRVFVDEIAVLVIENPAVSFTGCLMEALVEKKVKVIFCDSKRNPFAELAPHHGSHDSSLKIRTQAAWSKGIKDAVWTEIVSEKIRKQAEFLLEINRDREYDLLLSYISQIETGDASNREGHAAKVYFNALFGMDFTRSADIPVNAALNYGYSIILSAMNREIAANGYGENYQRSVELLSTIENYLIDMSFDFPCSISFPKLSLSSLIKSSGAVIESDGSISERVSDYMELVTELDKRKLFITLNMRSFIDDEEMSLFSDTVISHGYDVLMIENHAYSMLKNENRIIIDSDLCEIRS